MIKVIKFILKLPLYLLIFVLNVLKYALLLLGLTGKAFLSVLGAGRK